MSSNYGFTSFDTYLNKVNELSGSQNQNTSISLPQNTSDDSIFGNYENAALGLNTDYSTAYDSVFDQYMNNADNSNSSLVNNMSNINAFSGYENASSMFDGVDYSTPYTKILDNFFASISETDETGEEDNVDETKDDGNIDETDEEDNVDETEDDGNIDETDEEDNVDETKDDGNTDETDEEEPESEVEYTEEEQIAIYNAVEDILDASVRMSGTDAKSLVDVLSDENLSPKLMKAVQEELTNQGYDIFDIIRSETSGSTEDVLEGYALAKLGGKTKETKTELESYEKYENMNKDSVEYQKYIRNCMSLFRQAVNGPGTDEKVLTYIMSLPEDIRSDVEAKYNEKYSDERDFMQRGKDETGGLIHTEFYN